MFNIEYSIQLNGKQYSSKYPTNSINNGNVFTLKGRNDKGKTTLLKIVADAFGASERDSITISDHLKRDIYDITIEENNLNYNLTLGYPDGSTIVNIKYDGKHHMYWINDKEVGKSEFLKQYAVLFEVREKMSDKLQRHMDDVEHRFDQYLNYIKIYEGKLSELFEKVSNYEKSEEKLKDAEIAIKNLEEELSNHEKVKDFYHNEYVNKKREYINYIYEKKTSEFDALENQFEDITKRINHAEKSDRPDSNRSKSLLNKSNSLRDKIVDSKLIFQRLSEPELRNGFTEIYKNLKSLSNLESVTFEYLSSLSDYFQKVREYAKEESRSDISSEHYRETQELSFLKSFLDIIKRYSYVDLELPGSGKKLVDLLEPLEKRCEELKLQLGKYDLLENLDSTSEDIISQIGYVSIELKKYKDEDKHEDMTSEGENLEELNNSSKNIKQRLDKIANELSNIEDDYKSLSPEEKKNFRLDPQVEKDYEKTRKNYVDSEKEISDIGTKLKAQRMYKKNFENIKKPNTDLTLQDIISENKKIDELKNKFKYYTDKMEDITLPNLEGDGQLDERTLDFFDKIGTYLANVVEVIYHEHRMLKVKKIDFRNRQYVLEDGSTIKTSTVGSGHSSLNAITARIKNSFSDKKKILLIDEITDMDPGVKGFLIEEVKKQILSGESVLALLTEWNYDSGENELVQIV